MCWILAKGTNSNVTCNDRMAMTLAPCFYFDIPEMAYNDCCLLRHENKNGFQLYVPPLIEVGGTLIKLSRPINLCWIFVRFAIATYLCLVFALTVFTYITHYRIYYLFLYFTHWTLICAILYMFTSLLCSIQIYKKYTTLSGSGTNDVVSLQYQFNTQSLHEDKLRHLYTLNKILLQITLPSLSLITFNFWVLCDQTNVPEITTISPLEAISIHQIYGAVLIAVLIDFLCSAQKLYYKSPFWSILLFTVWTIFSIVFDTNGENQSGQPVIFEPVDWSQPTMIPLMRYCFSVLVLVLFNTLWTFLKNLLLLTKVKTINAYIPQNDQLESDDSELDQILA